MQVLILVLLGLTFLFVFFILAGLISIANILDIVVRHQKEMIKVLKNSKK